MGEDPKTSSEYLRFDVVILAKDKALSDKGMPDERQTCNCSNTMSLCRQGFGAVEKLRMCRGKGLIREDPTSDSNCLT